jgi:hypothetical protein
MTSRLACILFVALVPIVGLAVTCGLLAQDDTVSPQQKLQTLLQERRDALKSRLKALEKQHEVGLGELGVIVSARIDVLDAELELAATRAKRIELLKKRVVEFSWLEERAKARQRALLPAARPGRRTTSVDGLGDMYLATAARMQAEIDLLREEMTEE